MNNINEILEKYWEAETTLEEECQLYQYFNSSNISQEHQLYTDLFAELKDEKSVKAPDLSTFITQITKEDVTSVQKTKIQKLSIRRYIYAAAAVMTLAIASVFLFKGVPTSEVNSSEVVKEINDPDEALEVTMEALALISNKMNHSTEKVKEEMKVLQKISIF